MKIKIGESLNLLGGPADGAIYQFSGVEKLSVPVPRGEGVAMAQYRLYTGEFYRQGHSRWKAAYVWDGLSDDGKAIMLWGGWRVRREP